MNSKERLVALIRSHTDGVAVRHGDRVVTYADLGRKIDGRAHMIRPGEIVALERERSADFVLDYLAVLAAGGVAVPIDPQTPRERHTAFLDLTTPNLLWTDDGPERLRDEIHDVHPDGAFVYFTSGSTGRPKPVLGSAAAVHRFVTWFGPEFGIDRHDRFAFGSGTGFEASLRDIFPPLAHGATLVVPEQEADPQWLARNGITVVTVVPSVARTWLNTADEPCPGVRTAFLLGEPLTGDIVERWPTVFPSTTVLVNSYGATESGQGTVFKRVPPGGRVDRVTAGRPVPGTRYCFVDPKAPLTPAVVEAALERAVQTSGEIVIVGPACSRGYLGMPEENRARFADLGDGITAYRTGDLGRVDPHGDLVVVGRADDEVKINGVRVHPAEVTRALRWHPAVADAFVLTAATLIGFVVPAGDLDVAELRRDLMDTLPLAMIPARFVVLDALPKGRTGKVDRQALARLADRPADVPYVAPVGDLERWVADRFADLFGATRVSALDDFFNLGGDSIAAARLATRAGHDLGVDLSQRAVFAGATVTGIATAILERQLAGTDPDELRHLLDTLDTVDAVDDPGDAR